MAKPRTYPPLFPVEVVRGSANDIRTLRRYNREAKRAEKEAASGAILKKLQAWARPIMKEAGVPQNAPGAIGFYWPDKEVNSLAWRATMSFIYASYALESIAKNDALNAVRWACQALGCYYEGVTNEEVSRPYTIGREKDESLRVARQAAVHAHRERSLVDGAEIVRTVTDLMLSGRGVRRCLAQLARERGQTFSALSAAYYREKARTKKLVAAS